MQKLHSILLTRPLAASKRMKGDLLSINSKLNILISPLMVIQNCHYDFLHKDYGAYIFTSENAIKSVLVNHASLQKADVFCVGQQTEKQAIQAGYNVLGTYPRVRLLVSDLSNSHFKGTLMYFRGEHVSCDLKKILVEKGLSVEELIVYKQRAQSLGKEAFNLLSSKPTLMPLYSARTARLFSKEVAELPSKGHLVYCMSENIKSEIALNWNVEVAPAGSRVENLNRICQMVEGIN